MSDYSEERAKADGFEIIIGIDEAGRGPLAGPVVAGAVALKSRQFSIPIKDSKKMTARQREEAFKEILENASVGVGIVNEKIIDQVNILQATFLAMTEAVEQLVHKISHEKKAGEFNKKVCLLVDGDRFKSPLPYAHKTIRGGDADVLSISCASIIAKVTRDRILTAYDQAFPQYGFKKHKGYPTKEHKQALKTHGLSVIHRKTFSH